MIEQIKLEKHSLKTCFYSLHYTCHEKHTCGGSYIDSRDWIKNKQTTINPF